MDYKLVYFAVVGANFGGVEQKIIAQYDALLALRADIQLFLISKSAPNKIFMNEIDNRTGVKILLNSTEKVKNPIARRSEKFALMSSILTEYDPRSTIVYLRYPLSDFLFLKFLKKNKDYRIVTEHQEIENKLKLGILGSNFFTNILDFLFGKAVRRRITGFVGVTSDITNFERSYIAPQGHYFETIGNGIDINRYPLRAPIIEKNNKEIRLLFVGGGFGFHGLARLFKSLELYYKNGISNFDIKLKIAGDSFEMPKNRKFVKRLKFFSEVNFLGNVESENLDELFNWANVGVASLGLHKIGLTKSSTLKVREYFMRGLPFFWSSTDDDLPNNYPFILQLKAEDSLFDISEVISFVERIKLDEGHPQKMRQYAIDHLDWTIKMKKLIAFFDNIISTGF